MDRLTDLFLDGEFDEDEYREKRKSLEQKRDDIPDFGIKQQKIAI